MKKLLILSLILSGSLWGQVAFPDADSRVGIGSSTAVVLDIQPGALEIPPLDRLGNAPRMERAPDGKMVPHCSLHRRGPSFSITSVPSNTEWAGYYSGDQTIVSGDELFRFLDYGSTTLAIGDSDLEMTTGTATFRIGNNAIIIWEKE